MGFRNPGSIINSSVRRENDDAIKLRNPPFSIRKELDRIIGTHETFDFVGQSCVVVGREVVGFEGGYEVTYSLRVVIPLTEIEVKIVSTGRAEP